MDKIFLIIQREYLSRVKKKSFIIMTLLGPIFFAMVMVVPYWLSIVNNANKIVYVVDKSNLSKKYFADQDNIHFVFVDDNFNGSKNTLLQNNDNALLYLPDFKIEDPDGITLVSTGHISLKEKAAVEKIVNDAIYKERILALGIDSKKLQNLNQHVTIVTENISEAKSKNSEFAGALGLFLAVLIYFFIFLYGIQVMKGIIEEKSSRVVEVIISSVKPFELMMGKIIGIACVSLTQFLIWITFTLFISGVVTTKYGSALELFNNKNIEQTMSQTKDVKQAIELNSMLNTMEGINFYSIIGGFLFYFFGGYLLYSSLFAAVGSAVDTESDTQQFMLPVTIPLFVSFTVASSVIENPDGVLAYWMSIIPFTSPIIMMVRLPFGVPVQEIALSMLLLVTTFILTTWFAARIYRVGILMYGKKINYREISKWLFYKP